MSTSAEFIQINFGIPYFFRFQDFLPSHLAPCVGGSARHDAGQRGFSSFRRLIVKLSAGDALDKAFFFSESASSRLEVKFPVTEND